MIKFTIVIIIHIRFSSITMKSSRIKLITVIIIFKSCSISMKSFRVECLFITAIIIAIFIVFINITKLFLQIWLLYDSISLSISSSMAVFPFSHSWYFYCMLFLDLHKTFPCSQHFYKNRVLLVSNEQWVNSK